MEVVMVGDIASQAIMDDLPECGIVISATREELRNLDGNLLYRKVILAVKSEEVES